MARRSFSFWNGQPSNEPIYPQMVVRNPAVGPIGGQWMCNRNIGSTPYNNRRMRSFVAGNIPAASYGNFLLAAVQGVGFGVSQDDGILENGEAFTCYTGMDSQAASNNFNW